jgi:hypothetical protein
LTLHSHGIAFGLTAGPPTDDPDDITLLYVDSDGVIYAPSESTAAVGSATVVTKSWKSVGQMPGGGSVPDPLTIGTINVTALNIGGHATPELALLGPFTANYNSSGIESSGDGYALTTVTGPLLVLSTSVLVTTTFNGDVAPLYLGIYIGGPHYGPPDDDYGQIGQYGISSIGSEARGFQISSPVATQSTGTGKIFTTGAIVAQLSGGTNLSQGAATIYVLVLYL